MQAAFYLYSLPHPELIASIQLYFGHYHMVTIGNPHVYQDNVADVDDEEDEEVKDCGTSGVLTPTPTFPS